MDGQPGAADARRLQATVQLAGQRPTGERRRIDPVDRRVTVHHGVELRRRLASRRSTARLGRGRSGAPPSRRHRTGRPHRCGTARRTARCSEFPCATTGPPDLHGRVRPGSVRWPAAGSTTRTRTSRPLPGSTIRPARAANTAVGSCRRFRPGIRRPPRPPHRPVARRRPARNRSSAPRRAPTAPASPGRSTSARGTRSSTAAVTSSK